MSRLFRDVEGGPRCPHGSVVCIGAFDGLHLGHQALVRHTVARARALDLPALALSFEPLPREFFAGDAPPPRLLLPRAKVEGLFALGIDQVGLLRFNRQLSAMDAGDFVRRVLVERVGARETWVGPEFRFGKARGGDLALLQQCGREYGFVAGQIAPVALEGERVSSTRIRAALQAGDFASAMRLLGRPYAIGGRVVRGKQLGRTLGFPTANLRLAGKTPALSGIYASWVHGVGARPWPSVSSLGTRPTVDGIEPLVEAHLFDFDGDLYGRRIEVEFVAKLRDELKFSDLPALTAQMHRDADQARGLLLQDQRRAFA
ncbi:bifunctional riboflavin kinase/FAD synthetase [Lysobacter koreensis]|uniref:Riboflavin biosynthesis protein n=1 Tax=Lysobacter koreensis TaxID=266122 RepID=A0ABW2YL38_9GAMM